MIVVGQNRKDGAEEFGGVGGAKRHFIGGKNRRRQFGAGKMAAGEKKQLLFLTLPRVDIAEEVISFF